MAPNPRIEDLRKRLEKEPGSRLFAQLAEELRKDGELEEAIQVCREGLQRHSSYPSARMTLGRALFDTGDFAAARAELEAVLKGAPDNILASRLLAEALEGLGELDAARARYKTTLAMAPGDKTVAAKLEELERGRAAPQAVPAGLAGVPAPPQATPKAPEAPEPPPIKLVAVDEPMELERPFESRATDVGPVPGLGAPPAPPARRAETPPLRVSAVEEDFELEQPREAPTVSLKPGARAAPEAGGADAPANVEGTSPEVMEFDEAPTLAAGSADDFEHVLEPRTLPRGATPPPPFAERPLAAAPPDDEVPPPTLPLGLKGLDTEPPEVSEAAAEAAIAAGIEESGAEFVADPEAAFEISPQLDTEVAAEPEEGPTTLPPAAAAPAPVRVPATASEEIASVTLAELYFNQGFADKAVAVLRQLLAREPGNERARARLAELEAREAQLQTEVRQVAAVVGPGADSRAVRRQAIVKTIAQLEKMLAAIRRG